MRHLPALRERKEDIPLLAAHFVRAFNERTGADVPRGGIGPFHRLTRPV